MMRIHDLDDRMANFMSKTVMGAFFLARMVKGDQRISIQWKDEAKQSVLAYSNRRGEIKAVAYPGELMVGDVRNDFIYGTGILKVIRWDIENEYYQSFTNLTEDTFETNFQKYIRDSEQILSIIKMNTEIPKFGYIQARGIFLQALPEATDQDKERILRISEQSFLHSDLIRKPAEEIAHSLESIFLEKVDHLDQGVPNFRCDCSRNKIAEVLVTLGKNEVEEILEEQGKIEVECEFCKSIYDFDSEKVARLFPN
jgi:molecular chaperone Hsp33